MDRERSYKVIYEVPHEERFAFMEGLLGLNQDGVLAAPHRHPGDGCFYCESAWLTGAGEGGVVQIHARYAVPDFALVAGG